MNHGILKKYWRGKGREKIWTERSDIMGKKVRMGRIRMVHVEYRGCGADVGCEEVQKARCETWELCKGGERRGRCNKSVSCVKREMMQMRDEGSAGWVRQSNPTEAFALWSVSQKFFLCLMSRGNTAPYFIITSLREARPSEEWGSEWPIDQSGESGSSSSQSSRNSSIRIHLQWR